MLNSRDIRTKINIIKNTQKIVRAMELAAVNKMRNSRIDMEKTQPYALRILDVINHVMKAHSEYSHPYLRTPLLKKNIGMIIVSTDRGLCGTLNIDLFKMALGLIKIYNKKKLNVNLHLVGTKSIEFFKNLRDIKIASSLTFQDFSLPATPKIISTLFDSFSTYKVDNVLLCINKFVSAINQQPTVIQLLPILSEKSIQNEKSFAQHWDYLYEPDSKSVFDQLLVNYLDAQVQKALSEHLVCEQAARMIAMKNAINNADETITELKLQYNKARQAVITQELADILSGADAI